MVYGGKGNGGGEMDGQEKGGGGGVGKEVFSSLDMRLTKTVKSTLCN